MTGEGVNITVLRHIWGKFPSLIEEYISVLDVLMYIEDKNLDSGLSETSKE